MKAIIQGVASTGELPLPTWMAAFSSATWNSSSRVMPALRILFVAIKRSVVG
jgi:hypothetical protein